MKTADGKRVLADYRQGPSSSYINATVGEVDVVPYNAVLVEWYVSIEPELNTIYRLASYFFFLKKIDKYQRLLDYECQPNLHIIHQKDVKYVRRFFFGGIILAETPLSLCNDADVRYPMMGSTTLSGTCQRRRLTLLATGLSLSGRLKRRRSTCAKTMPACSRLTTVS